MAKSLKPLANSAMSFPKLPKGEPVIQLITACCIVVSGNSFPLNSAKAEATLMAMSAFAEASEIVSPLSLFIQIAKSLKPLANSAMSFPKLPKGEPVIQLTIFSTTVSAGKSASLNAANCLATSIANVTRSLRLELPSSSENTEGSRAISVLTRLLNPVENAVISFENVSSLDPVIQSTIC